MDQNLSNIALQIIEVPPELRGLTDEEIIQNSEKKRDFSGKRKNGAARPSKKDRLALKQQKEEVKSWHCRSVSCLRLSSWIPAGS